MFHLNMFKSEFELNAKHADKSAFLSLWGAPATVHQLHRDDAGRETFLLHDGPPYANGKLHAGHFVNKTLKDALLKFKRLDGYFAPFVPGFDCHGLPVELEVEKQGVSKADPVAFVDACRSYAQSQVALQTSEFQSFGVSADWEHPYLTMEPHFEAQAARYFSQMPQRVSRLRPVHWCAACGSSLAEAEVEYKVRTSPSVELRFPVVGRPGLALLVWTTTPYTLPANKGVAFNPNLSYVVAASGEHRLVRLRTENDPADLEVVDVTGWHVESPFTGLTVPVVAADYVTSSGTGFVHLGPSFGMDDFRVGEANGFAVEHFLDDRGRFLPGLAGRADWGTQLAGLGLEAAGELVLEKLAPWVESQTRLEHQYPYCWRHKKPLFFKASDEWFLDLTDVGPQALRALEEVRFTPETGRDRLSAMLQTRTSWCLSRTRLWGTPLAVSEQELASLGDVETQGVRAWHVDGPRRTLDVWFDSGVTHALVMQERFGRTADLYLEGSDQHRGWFQSSLLTSVSVSGRAPYKEVVTHGFVVDEKGMKYSKSSGNYVPLDKLFEQYSPDQLRLWALSQDYTHDLKLSKESLARTTERYRKLRNTLRFCLQNTADWDFSPREVSHVLDRHQLSEMGRVVRQVRDAAQRYDFAEVVSTVVQFCEVTSADYFTALKDTLYCDAPNAPRRRDAQYVLGQLLGLLLRVLMPVLPFTVEEVFQSMRAQMGLREACSLLLTWEGVAFSEKSTSVPAWSALKATVNRHVEANRDEFLKSAAQLDVTVWSPTPCDASELGDYLGCAEVRLASGPWAVEVSRTVAPLCPRCRRHGRGVLLHLCPRCEAAEAEVSEARGGVPGVKGPLAS